MSLHNGSHADARFHFEKDGSTIDQADHRHIGPATVVDLTTWHTAASHSNY
jgi:kynurenine formamidase